MSADDEFNTAWEEATAAPTYDTKLTAAQEVEYQKAFPDAGATADYDMRGAFAAGIKPAKNGHFPDTYKKPNHITFSDESQYHGVDGNQGGKWTKSSTGTWSFTPGPTNMANYTAEQMKTYFKKYEPDSTLVLPLPAQDPVSVNPLPY